MKKAVTDRYWNLLNPEYYYKPDWLVKNWGTIWKQQGPALTAKVQETMPKKPVSHAQVLQFADMIVVATRPLAEVVRKLAPGKPIHVLPNVIDRADFKPVPRPQDGKIRIGYTGWVTHSIDAHLILPGLYDAGREFPNLEIWFYGWHPALYKGADSPGAYTWEGIKYQYGGMFDSVTDFHRAIGTFDVGLAPLRDGEFNRGKSAQKWFEHSTHGTAMVVSDLPPYQCVENCVTGLKARHATDFNLHINWLCRDAGWRQLIGQRARNAVLARHTTAQWADHWRRAVAPVERAVAV